MTDYPPPVDLLLNLGEPKFGNRWRDYGNLGIRPEHIPELIRMMGDMELNHAEGEEVWAPAHAWRALAELKATEAVRPFLNLLVAMEEDEGDDWIMQDAPEFFGRIGLSALPTLVSFLEDQSQPVYPRWAAASSLRELAKVYPETRPEVVAVLTRLLERAAENEPELNGALIIELVNLNAVEVAPVMERAFATGNVDEMMAGDWEYVRYDLGLRPDRPLGPRYDLGLPPLEDLPLATPSGHTPSARAKERAKARRKATKQARKKNRKKKR